MSNLQERDVRQSAAQAKELCDRIGISKADRVGMEVRRVSESPWGNAYKNAVTGTKFTIRRDRAGWVLVQAEDTYRSPGSNDMTSRLLPQAGIVALWKALLEGIATVGDDVDLVRKPKIRKSRLSATDLEAIVSAFGTAAE